MSMSDVTWIPITQRERLSKGTEPILLASWFCSLLLFFTDWVSPWPPAVSSNFRSCQGEEAPLWDHFLVESGPDAQTRVSRAGQAAISTERERRALHRSRASQPWLALPAEFSTCDPVHPSHHPPPRCHATCRAWDKTPPFTFGAAHGQGNMIIIIAALMVELLRGCYFTLVATTCFLIFTDEDTG